jgi:putative ABC transport system permease protein
MGKNTGMFAGKWFFTFFRKSIAMRKGRLAVASVSVTLAVAVITAMAVITGGISKKLGDELKAYGANIIVSPLETGGLDNESINEILKIKNVMSVSGQLFTRVFIRDQAVEVIGLDISSLKNRGWRLSGKWPEKQAEALAGVNLKEAAGLKEGGVLSVGSQTGEKKYVITGFIEKGGFEDNALIMSLKDTRDMTDEKDAFSALLVRGDPHKLEGIADSIKKTLHGVSVKTLRQVAVAEKSLLGKMKLLMFMVTVVILLASGISVGSTVGASVLERREEIGLMKAIGGTGGQIRLFFMSETTIIGIIGGVAGCIMGAGAAQVIAKGAFDSSLPIAYYVPAISLITGIALSLFAGHFPVRNALKYNPAVILREE